MGGGADLFTVGIVLEDLLGEDGRVDLEQLTAATERYWLSGHTGDPTDTPTHARRRPGVRTSGTSGTSWQTCSRTPDSRGSTCRRSTGRLTSLPARTYGLESPTGGLLWPAIVSIIGTVSGHEDLSDVGRFCGCAAGGALIGFILGNFFGVPDADKAGILVGAVVGVILAFAAALLKAHSEAYRPEAPRSAPPLDTAKPAAKVQPKNAAGEAATAESLRRTLAEFEAFTHRRPPNMRLPEDSPSSIRKPDDEPDGGDRAHPL